MWYVLAFLVGTWIGFIVAAFMIGAHSNEEQESGYLDNTK